MPRTYSEDDRQEALELLGYNRNNITLTSAQTGIPERTLREWRRKQRIERSLLPPDPPSAAAAEPTGNAIEALEFVYNQIIEESSRIAASLPEILAAAPPYHQVLAFAQLIDRLPKLHSIINQSSPPQAFRVEFVDADGTTHDSPFWKRKGEDADDEED